MVTEFDALKKPMLAVGMTPPEKGYSSVTAKISAYPVWQNDRGEILAFGDVWDAGDRDYSALSLKFWIFHDHTGYSSADLEYREVYSINANRAEKMHKTLQRIRRRNEQYSAAHGSPSSFGQEVARFAWAIGAKRVLIWIDDKTYDRYCSGDAIAEIDRRYNDLVIDCQIKAGTFTGKLKRFTTATEDYDGFGTTTIETRTIEGKPVRVVEIDGSNYTWQVSRYESGLAITGKTHAEMSQRLR